MFAIRKLRLMIWAALIAACSCSQTDTQPMQALLDKLSHGPESDFPSLLYGYKQSSAGAQSVLVSMLKVLRAPSSGQHMTVDKFRRAGRFTMIVAHVPWPRGPDDYEYQPIIICRESEQEQIVGYMLPFNDVIPLFQEKDSQSLFELTEWYLQEYGSRIGRKR